MKETHVIPKERIIQSIFVMRGQKVMSARDLSVLYGVETKALNQAVKRNIDRFPEDFMFQLTREETKIWKSQFVTSNSGDKMGLRKDPIVFTEQGILMLSSVLKSERAIQVNIQIVRTFIKLREMLSNYKEVKEKIEAMEKKYDQRFKVVFDTLKQLLTEEEKPKRKIGFSQK
ncbi:MAG: ORF6N domain-containing protein [Candidatus Paceibacterota bacterium]|jgi:hypothetical protein|nr:ORF6N domain-containing protein [Candidatus Paceibacterota bacterium]